MEEILFDLKSQYKAAATKPINTTVVVVTSKEKVVVEIARMLFDKRLANVHRDNLPSPFNRMLTALRALNNVADNYISTELTAGDNGYTADYQNVRKTGRQIIMMSQYDAA